MPGNNLRVTCHNQISVKEGRVRCNEKYQLVVGRNGDIASASFLTFHGDNIKECDKEDRVTNI